LSEETASAVRCATRPRIPGLAPSAAPGSGSSAPTFSRQTLSRSLKCSQRREPADEAQDQLLAALAAAADPLRQRRPRSGQGEAQFALDRVVGQVEPGADLRPPAALDVEGEDLALKLGQRGERVLDQRAQLGLLLLGDRLLLGARLGRYEALQGLRGGVEGNLVNAVGDVADELAVSRGGDPDVDLAGGGDLLRPVDEAPAGDLDRFLYLLRRAVAMLGGEPGAKPAPALAPQDRSEQFVGAVWGGSRP
jgi:hypothetical protein